MPNPLVSVICLSYNHERFVEECIYSVINQTYSPIELIVVDDASTDGSAEEIQKLVDENPQIVFLPLKENLGNCKAFNKGLALAKGDYVVDLATDDVFLPTRIEKQINLFNKLSSDYGVIHTNVDYIDECGQQLRDHTGYLIKKGLLDQMPTGDIYKEVISKFFISPASMLVKREIFDALNGYDEKLAYEDFDFWVRSARNWKYAYLDEKLTKVRKVAGSLSTGWYKKGDKQLYSTYLVCKKIQQLNQTKEEDQALVDRLKFEIRQAVFSDNYREAQLFFNLLREYESPDFLYKALLWLSNSELPLAPLRNLYHRLRYG